MTSQSDRSDISIRPEWHLNGAGVGAGLGWAGSVGAVTEPRRLDTVKNAEQTPEVTQPWAELGLKSDEFAQMREILGRRPTSSELAMYSVMWSEHCSYKSSKVHLRQFGENVSDEMRAAADGRDRRECRRRRHR